MNHSRGEPTRNDPLGLTAAVLAVLGFGTGNVLVKLIDLPGTHIVLWRLAGAALLYFLIMKMRGGSLSVALMKSTFLTGLLFGSNLVFGYLAVKQTTVANASVIGALQPLFIVAFVSRRFGEMIERWLLIVTPVAFSGTALVIFGSSTSTSWSAGGDALAFGSMFLWVGYFAAAKSARGSIGVVPLQAASLIWASLVVAPLSIVNGALIDDALPGGRDGALILALILIPGTGHALMNWAHAHIEISRASLLTLGVPVIATIGAFIFLDESIVAAQAVGIGIVLAALAYTVNRSAGLTASEATKFPRLSR